MAKLKYIPIICLLIILTSCRGMSAEDLQVNNTLAEDSDSSNEEVEYQDLSVEEKIEDFEYLFKILEDNYPFFETNKRLHGIDWIANKDSYLDRVKETESDLEFYMLLNSIVKDLNHSHTRIFDDKLYVNALNLYQDVSMEPWLSVLENPIVQNRYRNAVIENKEEEEFIYPDNIVLEKWSGESSAYIKIKTFNHANIEGDWERLQPFINDLDDVDSLIIDIRGNYGGDSHYWSEYLLPALIDEPKESWQYYCFRGGDYVEPFVSFALGYPYDEMEVIDEVFNENFFPDVPDEIEENFTYYIKNTQVIEPSDDNGFQGDIYLLVDRDNYSSSAKLVQFVKETGLAYIVGEQISGESSGFDSILLGLPNSGYVIQFPALMVLDSSGVNLVEFPIQPDVSVESGMALDEVLEMIHKE